MVALDQKIAVVGFPLELEPWSWYHGMQVADDPDPLFSEEDTEAGRAARAEYLRKFGEELQAKRAKQAARRKELHDRPISRPLAFRPSVSGRGKWHVPYADVYGNTPTQWVANPRRETACGHGTIELDLDEKPIVPDIGEHVSRYADHLCGTCLGFTQKAAD
jgi:hypothetical protein